jgi:hypothetical protein
MRRAYCRDAVVGTKVAERTQWNEMVLRKFIAHSFIQGAMVGWNFFSNGSFHFDSVVSSLPACGIRIARISPVSVCLPSVCFAYRIARRILRSINRVSSLPFLALQTGNN